MSERLGLRHRLEYRAVVAVRGVVRVLPRRLAALAGTGIGIAFYALDWRHRRLATANLAAALPHRTPRERRRVVRGVFGHFGRLLVDMLRFSALRPDQMMKLVDYEGLDRVRQAFTQGKGALYFTGHFGFWEIQAVAHAVAHEPIGLLARALDNPALNRLLEEVRTSTGNHVIYRRGAVRRVLRALESNQGVALLIDQHIQTADAVHVDFFSRPAATTAALAALALRTGAPVIPVFALPLPGGRYRMIYEHPVEVPDRDDPESVRILTQRCTDVLEMYVRRYPELWLWMHRRWRDEDSAAAAGGMFPAGTESGDVEEIE